MGLFDDRGPNIQIPSVYMELRNVPGTTEGLLLPEESKYWLGWIEKISRGRTGMVVRQSLEYASPALRQYRRIYNHTHSGFLDHPTIIPVLDGREARGM